MIFTSSVLLEKKVFHLIKKEGDLKTPKGNFKIGNLYYRADRINKPLTKLKTIPIKKNMGWCNDINNKKKYNKLVKISKILNTKKCIVMTISMT